MKEINKIYLMVTFLCVYCSCGTKSVTYNDYRLLFKEKIYKLSAFDTSNFTIQFTNYNTYELEVKRINNLSSGKYLIYNSTKEHFEDRLIGASFSIYCGRLVEGSDSLLNDWFQQITFPFVDTGCNR